MILYTSPTCRACPAVKGALERAGYLFTIIDVTVNSDASCTLSATGVSSLPAIEAGGRIEGGVSPARAKEIAAETNCRQRCRQCRQVDGHKMDCTAR
jgi:glutaredoxin